jgi:hypothetical protein
MPCARRPDAGGIDRRGGGVHPKSVSQEKTMKTAGRTLLSAAVSGILLGVPAMAGASPVELNNAAAFDVPGANPMGDVADGGAKHACKGQNECKGQGGCKTDKHSCKGQNTCKGQGGCRTDGKK